MAKYNLTNEYQEIAELEGSLPNNSVLYPILIAASKTPPDINTPYKAIASGETQNFKAADGEKIYLRLFTNDDQAQFEVSVVTFIPEQIQNCYVELGTKEHPLVGGFSVKDGMMHKVQVDAPIPQGNGTIFDPNGMQGVIDEESGSMQIGTGYENFIKANSSIGGINGAVSTLNKWAFTIDGTGQGRSARGEILTTCNVNVGDKVTLSIKNLKFTSPTMYCRLKIGTTYEVEVRYDIFIDGSHTFTTKNTGVVTLALYSGTGVTSGEEISLTKTSHPVPFVPNTAPNGRLVIDEEYGTNTHSFLGIAVKGTTGNAKTQILSFGIWAQAENVYVSTDEEIDFFLSKSVGKYIRSDDTVGNLERYLNGVTSSEMSLTSPSLAQKNERISHFIIYKGDLREDGFMLEREKIKSGKYIIPQKFVGTPHNIPYFLKKAGDNGITYTTTKVDQNRDTFLAEEYGFYEFIPKSTGVPKYGYVEKVNDVWTVPSFFTNVSGILRVTEEGQIRKVG